MPPRRQRTKLRCLLAPIGRCDGELEPAFLSRHLAPPPRLALTEHGASVGCKLDAVSFDFYDERVRPLWKGGGEGAWDHFVKWATKFYSDPAFDQDERQYKLDAIPASCGDCDSGAPARTETTRDLLVQCYARTLNKGDA